MDIAENRASWGRFTVYGPPEVENLIAEHMTHVARTVQETFAGQGLVTLVLLGGYGRGEGGIVERDGVLKPHNNFDFCLIFEQLPLSQRGAMEALAHELSRQLPEKLCVGCDFSLLDLDYLKHAPPLIIWFDMKNAHKVIWGPLDVLQIMPDRTASDIPLADAARLLLNRGTLFVINQAILQQRRDNLSRADKETMIKHIVKGIIGYGDSVLLARGAYHQSYVEKAQRFTNIDLSGVPNHDQLRQLYALAAEFRFRPDYESFLKRDLGAWHDELVSQLEPIHLWFEQTRLGQTLTWENYLAHLADSREKTDVGGGLKQKLKATIKPFYFFLKNTKQFGFSFSPWQFRHPKDRLLALFPAVIYPDLPEAYRKQAAALVGLSDTTRLLQEFLRLWGQYGDSNFVHVLRKLKLEV